MAQRRHVLPILLINRGKRYRLNHPDRVKTSKKKYKENHPEKYKESAKKQNDIHSHINNPKRINFKGKQIFVGKIIRSGICSKCGRSVSKGEIKRTVLHHTKYDPSNPLANTIELCSSCHNDTHWEMRKNK